jgi:signal transduction histidine kinase
MPSSERFDKILNRVLQVIVLVYQGIALAAFVAVPFLAANWLNTPFLGAFTEQTMIFNGVGSTRADPAWGLFNQGVRLNYQLLQVDGKDVHSSTAVAAALKDVHVGDQVPVTVLTPQGQRQVLTVTLHDFPAADRTAYFYIPYAVGLLFLAISLWIFGMRRSEAAGRAFALFATSVAIGTGAFFDLYTTHALSWLWTFALACAGGALINLAVVFPQEFRWSARLQFPRYLGYVAAIVLTGMAAFTLYNVSDPTAYILSWRYIYILAGISVIFFVAAMLFRSLAPRSPVVRQQARIILLGILIGFGPLAAWFLISSVVASLPADVSLKFGWLTGFFSLNFPPYLILFTVVFPAVTGYTILRFRLVRTDFMLRQGVLYALLSVLAIVTYALLVSGLTLVFGHTFSATNPLLVGTAIFAFALGLNPLRNRLQHLIDVAFFRGEIAYQQRVENFTHELTNTVDLGTIVRALQSYVNASLMPDRLHVYVYDPLNDNYTAAAGDDGRPTSDLRFNAGTPLVQALSKTHVPIFFGENDLPAELRSEEARLRLLGAVLFVPLPGGERLTGWLALGARRSGQNYASRDLNFLDLICSQAAVAIERAQVIFNLERRVREMNILARVAQGVNVTVTYDDILELIYAQTDQILPVDDFHITLYNKENDYSYFAFCLENDDRITARENLPLPPGTGLGPDVIRTRRPILTSDYARECQGRGVKPLSSGTLAWLGIPLNAGAETIGALTVGSRDPGVVYTPGQLELLQSIADQAAGAIVKARLLQETERRARQLTSLNEITRQLTGTLETEPLLQNILDSAVGILNCEAGSLFLVDEQTDEMIFKATAGPVASNLAGQRLAPGTGIVGQAVQTRTAVISNNVQQASTWFAATDQQTGFVTRSILAVPMQIKDRVIGVLEVINRKDGLPFVDDDQNLLSAFGGQAAVAIENARLYTLTDQELNARVEELSVMQRIDRELNASLDVARAMRLTLDWAMRQSNAEAGLVGILEEKGIRLMAQQGYETLEQTYKENPIPLDQAAMRAAVDSGLPQHVNIELGRSGLLLGAVTQTVVPIRREANVIGLLVMESRSPDSHSDQTLPFLTRLSDHAAIAIANAQLYSAVQEANNSKSEFVSFVAHELKNPMTSIKGYSELLASGAVGTITEMQANFLVTIRSNVERMSTLVSDLNDNSKIEAGKLRLDFKAVDIAEVADEVLRSSKRQMDDKKQAVILEIADKLPSVWADRTRLAQILTNFVSNANKYTPDGGRIVFGAERSSNQWDPQGAAEVVHIWVKDNGIGISLEDQQKIFEKFFRSEDQKAREAPGTGLGLNITKSLIEMMGGRVWFESEFRLGTTFHFTVPVAQG